MSSFDGAGHPRDPREVPKRKSPKAGGPAAGADATEDRLTRLLKPAGPPYVASDVARELRLRGEALLFDASSRRNDREVSAGHIMVALGQLIGAGGTWSAEEVAALAKRDFVLNLLEDARKAVQKAVRLEREREQQHQARAREHQRSFARSLGEADPGAYTAPLPSIFEKLAPNADLTTIARRYVQLLLEWWNDASGSEPKDEALASWLELSRSMLLDTKLLGRLGTADERRAAWRPLIAKVLDGDARTAQQRAQRIVAACARQQGHARADNYFPD